MRSFNCSRLLAEKGDGVGGGVCTVLGSGEDEGVGSDSVVLLLELLILLMLVVM